ncbi:hypothetical protein QTP88_003245 [Uroleucon formosanum]
MAQGERNTLGGHALKAANKETKNVEWTKAKKKQANLDITVTPNNNFALQFSGFFHEGIQAILKCTKCVIKFIQLEFYIVLAEMSPLEMSWPVGYPPMWRVN